MQQRRGISSKIAHEPESHDRWVVSYADFITLLFAFFVTMYALSVVNEGKYRILADSLGLAFLNITPLAYSVEENEQGVSKTVNRAGEPNGQLGLGALTPHFLTKPAFFELTDEMRHKLEGGIDKSLMTIEETENWLELTLNTNVLFAMGSAILLPDSDKVFLPLRDILSSFASPIQVEGFSDNIPIENELFPSNWELSAARAAAVVRRFIELKLSPERFVVTGYGSNFPVASNSTALGRQQNRRVVLVIAKNERMKRLREKTFKEPEPAVMEKAIKQQKTTGGIMPYTILPSRTPSTVNITEIKTNSLKE
ncbi:OmpA family protein [Candidatus Berkiella cookevillensis]|uniref:Motility protein B n=1 Tax=Candidatus Berkiella cookevillensis TaxID=437022 RepID=A0A0Q9YUN3_9GAMM|nr:flagellar motor protein MotB [Candidatus Berkiella cookevillensis]MCS5708591.1 OmpA family protein [Candidatus Berkiella cookevillensis]